MRSLSLGLSVIACVVLASSCDSSPGFERNDGGFIAPIMADSSVGPGTTAGALPDAAASGSPGGGTPGSGASSMDAGGVSMGSTDAGAPGPTAEASVVEAGGPIAD